MSQQTIESRKTVRAAFLALPVASPLSIKSLYRMISEGQGPSTKRLNNRVLVVQQEFDDWVSSLAEALTP